MQDVRIHMAASGENSQPRNEARGSSSDEQMPDINLQRQQMIQWGLPFLQYLMRQELIPNMQVNQQQEVQKRTDAIIK